MTKTNETLALQIVRKFAVTPEVVFDTFTKPEAMRVWWTEQTTFAIDLRVGGRWTITRTEGETVILTAKNDGTLLVISVGDFAPLANGQAYYDASVEFARESGQKIKELAVGAV